MHLKSLKRLLAPVLCILLVFGSVFGLTSCESVTTTVDTSTRNNSAFGEFPTIAASPADWDSPIVFTYEQSDENQIAQEKTQSGKWYESRKNIGSCEELNGRVLLYFIFVDEPGLSWNASDKAQLHAQATDTIRLLESEAAAEGVSLTVSSSETDIVWTKTIGWNKDGTANTCDSVMNLLLSNSGSRTFSEMYQSMLSAYNVDSIAYILLSLSTGRGYAHSDTTGSFSHCEHAVLFEKKGTDLLHELLHLFGAIDFYYPEKVRKEAKQILGDNIMLNSGKIDDFTKYLIGWDQTPSATAQAFLDAVASVTKQVVDTALSEEWESDYVEKRV